MLCTTGGAGVATSGVGGLVTNNGGLLENATPVAFPNVTVVFLSVFLEAEVVCNLNRINGLDGVGSVISLSICARRYVNVDKGSLKALCKVLSKLPAGK